MSNHKKQRRHFSPEEKVLILKKHLLEKIPVSDLCEQNKLQPTVFYRWLKDFFNNAHRAFDSDRKSKSASTDKDRQIQSLEEKLRRKHEVLSEIMEEFIQLKKDLGEA